MGLRRVGPGTSRDWSRDLYAAPDEAASEIDIGAGDALYVASVDGSGEAQAHRILGRVRSRLPGVLWAKAIALDRHAPILGLRKVASDADLVPLGETGLNETLFTPITPRTREARE